VASDAASFATSGIHYGLFCATPSVPLVRNVPAKQAMEMLLTGDFIDARTALERGLVNRVVPPAECNALAQAQARKLAAKPLTALIETKRLMKAGQAAQVRERMDEEGLSFGRLMGGPAAKEAFSAFMEKRRPDFSKC